MSHALILGLFTTQAAAAAAVRSLHDLGISAEQISVVARGHDEEGALAEQMGATLGADLEDSRPAAMLGELGGKVLAAIALIMPGIGPIVTAGPLSAGLGEAAGHVAGSVASVLSAAGLPDAEAQALQREVEAGRLLIGVHADPSRTTQVSDALAAAGGGHIAVTSWEP